MKHTSFSFSMYKDSYGIHTDAYGGILPCRSLGKTDVKQKLLHIRVIFICPIWLLKLYSKPGKLNFKSILEGFEADSFSWSLALCSGCAGSTGLANRASVPACAIFSDKWTVLVEFCFTIGVINQAVSADAVSCRAIAIHGAQATVLQRLLFAVTAINNNREGGSGWINTLYSTSGRCMEVTCLALRSRLWHTKYDMKHTCTCKQQPVQFIQTIKCLAALTHTHTLTQSSYGFNASLQAEGRGGCSSCTAGKGARGRRGGLATITSLIANCQGFRTKGNFKSL